MNLISRLINRSGLRIPHSKVFSSVLITEYTSNHRVITLRIIRKYRCGVSGRQDLTHEVYAECRALAWTRNYPALVSGLDIHTATDVSQDSFFSGPNLLSGTCLVQVRGEVLNRTIFCFYDNPCEIKDFMKPRVYTKSWSMNLYISRKMGWNDLLKSFYNLIWIFDDILDI